MRANADLDSLVPRFYLRGQDSTSASCSRGDCAVGSGGCRRQAEPRQRDDAAAPEPPSPLPTAGSAVSDEAELAAERPATWQLLEERRLDPRPAGRRAATSARPTSRQHDRPGRGADARTARRAALGYHDHYVVDGGKARIILRGAGHPGRRHGEPPMLDLLWRVRFRWQLRPEAGDRRHDLRHRREHPRRSRTPGIRAYVPLPDLDERTPFFGTARFTYDAERDEYRCPQGQSLRFRRPSTTERVRGLPGADAATCNACPLKAACTDERPGPHGPPLASTRPYLERVRGYHETAAYQKAMRKRAGLGRAAVRGSQAVARPAPVPPTRAGQGQHGGLLVAAGQNLKRWLAATGWGGATAPGEPAGSPAPPPVPLGVGFSPMTPLARGPGRADCPLCLSRVAARLKTFFNRLISYAP